jgi:phosphomannomutase
MRPLKLGSAGIRGIIGDGLTSETAVDFASAFGTFTGGSRVVVAVDTRFSSDMLRHAVVSALLSCGCEVFDAGIAPVAFVGYSVRKLKADGALLIGGGHQGIGWNSILPLGRDGAYLNNIQLRELFDIYHSRRYLGCVWDKVCKLQTVPGGFAEEYLDSLCNELDVAAIKAAKLKVVADFCNGSGSVLSTGFAERLGLDMIPINNILSGILPHDPEPRPRSGFQVQSIMKPLNADAGFVFNSDMSRVAVVTNEGETLSEEYTFPLGADYLLGKSNESCARVITNICSTRTLDDVVARHGGMLEKTKVGQANVVDLMKESDALLGGEGCGGFTAGNWLRSFDGFFMMGTILEAMAIGGSSLTELAERLPRYHIVKKTIHCPSSHAYTLIRSLRDHFHDAAVNEEDGIRFDWEDGWISLRASTTEQVIRLICEWKDQDAALDKALQVRGLMERLVAS